MEEVLTSAECSHRVVKEQFKGYFISLCQDVPVSVYVGQAFVFCLGAVLMLAFCGLKKGLRYSSCLLLVEYVFMIYCSTVIFRPYNDNNGHNFYPFWSYAAIAEGQEDLISENIMNVVAFVPVGLLLGIAFRSMKWWRALLIGACISIGIETMQYVFNRGFSEFDDVMHNTLGCLVGYLLVIGSLQAKRPKVG